MSGGQGRVGKERGDNGNSSSLLSIARKNSLLDQETSLERLDTQHQHDHQQHQQEFSTSDDESSTLFPTLGHCLSEEGTSISSVGASVPDLLQRNPIGSHLIDHAHGRRGNKDAKGLSRRAKGASTRVPMTIGVDSEKERDHYVKSGTHFRSLLDNAFRQVSVGFANSHEVEVSLTTGDHQKDDSAGGKENRIRGRGNGQKRSRKDHGNKRPSRKRRLQANRCELDELVLQDIGEEPNLDQSGNRHATELAREKSAEVVALKKSLKEAEEHKNAMANANKALRDASATSTARLENLSEALRIAGERAANARADADAADARASSLAIQLNSFKTALDETKRTVESIRREHDDISSTARDFEAKLLQKDSELKRIQKLKERDDENKNSIMKELQKFKDADKILKECLDEKDDTISKLKKLLSEQENIEKARLGRTRGLENELRKSRSMLIELTSTAAEGESTTAQLQETIGTLKKENESLHEKINQSVNTASREKTKIRKELAEAESELQKYRLKSVGDDEELQKLRLDKDASEKELIQLKNLNSNLERRLAEVSAAGVMSPGDAISDISTDSSSFASIASTINKASGENGARTSNKDTDEFIIPKLKSVPSKVPTTPVEKKSNGKVNACRVVRRCKAGIRSSQNNCSICFKQPYGVMKSCQCGDSNCEKRAHATCIVGNKSLPSVSHPGSAAPKLPLILCRKR